MTFKELRIRRALPQSELADLIDVKHTTISNWETGLSQPSIKVRRDLAAALHISLEELAQLFPPRPRRPMRRTPARS